jgi:nicotinamidase-related amidase
MTTLIVVDMQNDFIDGALTNPAAQAIVKPLAEYIKDFEGEIIFTRDTHFSNYLSTQEGRNLPIPHCLYESEGWKINKELADAAFEGRGYFNDPWTGCVDKTTFGDITGIEEMIDTHTNRIYICGTCTDICVISIALNLKALFPEKPIVCLSQFCAGLTPEKHAAALEVMRSCQIEVV